MCIFSGTVTHVGSTKIFARLEQDRQYLVYSMNVAAEKDVAMVLPLPVSSHAADAVNFINLEKYPDFFEDMEKAFVSLRSRGMKSFSGPASFTPLKVHDVGQFIASFVPNRASFLRLDPQFRLDAAVWRELPNYDDYGFAVFQLKLAGGEEKKVHPMAFSFPTRFKHKLFFPTVHLHDGEFHENEEFDHHLYWQGIEVINRSEYKLSDMVAKSEGIVIDDVAYKVRMGGTHPNRDVFVGAED